MTHERPPAQHEVRLRPDDLRTQLEAATRDRVGDLTGVEPGVKDVRDVSGEEGKRDAPVHAVIIGDRPDGVPARLASPDTPARSVFITSNLIFAHWDRIFRDQMATAAAIDRLVHHWVLLECDVSSFRTEQAKRRGKATPRPAADPTS